MRTEQEVRAQIAARLMPLLTAGPSGVDLFATGCAFWETLGYRSERILNDLHAASWEDFESIVAAVSPGAPVRGTSAPSDLRRVFDRVQRIVGLFQYDNDDVLAAYTGQRSFPAGGSGSLEPGRFHSYVFLAVELSGDTPPTRTDLAALTREVNRLFAMPVLLLVRSLTRGSDRATLTLAVQKRRLHRHQADREVLGKVTLVKDIALTRQGGEPNRAHLEILNDLSFDALRRRHPFTSFDGLHEAWTQTLDTSALNSRFYQELADWYFWARDQVSFGTADEKSDDKKAEAARSRAVIRLITRLIFVWFLKEKGLVPEELFRADSLRPQVRDFDSPAASTYYKAILQNLFFATLNAEMDDPKRPRRFVQEPFQGKQADRGLTDLWRYEKLLTFPEWFMKLVARVPFLNGGLFECLDIRDEKGVIIDVQDCFTEGKDGDSLRVPNELFFGDKRAVSVLNTVYDTKDKRYEVGGLIPLLSRYKFTVEENTPVEQEIALDPELLGRVFENLLASYNPETSTTARKQTGSFYTPREIVDYMVDEALVAYLDTQTGVDEERLRRLIGYEDADQVATGYLSADEIRRLVEKINAAKVLDPACGSGAFPMGVLQKLVHLLRQLDPDNRLWKEQQLQPARNIPDPKSREAAEQAIEATFADHNERDYARKLYLIENCIYGVDIQPIAVQIAKLRCFISLVVDQKVSDALPNLGIIPLPNLETKFVAANALLPSSPGQPPLESEEVKQLRSALEAVREKHFLARSMESKRKQREADKSLRARLRVALEADGMVPSVADRLASWNPYDQQGVAAFFDPAWMFLIRDGFDIVIANPPYVRQERIRAEKPLLKLAYPDVFDGVADLYTYFYALAVKHLKPNGTLAFISSNKWFRTGYGEKLREFIADRCEIQTIIDFGDQEVFENTIAYPLVFIARKIEGKHNPTQSPVFVPVKKFDGDTATQGDVRRLVQAQGRRLPAGAISKAQWSVADDAAAGIRARIEKDRIRLDAYLEKRSVQINYGIKTGLNRAFVIPGPIKDNLIAANEKNAEIIKPFAAGRDIRRWVVSRSDDWLIFSRRGINIDAYPDIKARLLPLKTELTPRPRDWDETRNGAWPGRKPGTYEWYEIQDEVAYYKLFDGPKIVMPDISPEMRFALDEDGLYCGNTAYIIAGRDLYLLGLLNSPVLQAFYTEISSQVRGGYLRFFKQYVAQLPIAKAEESQATVVASFAGYITHVSCHLQAAKSVANPRDTLLRDYFEQLLNGLVYELYFPEDLHAAGLRLFDQVAHFGLPDLDALPEGERIPRLRALFETLYASDHPLRGALFQLGSLEIVRTIEGRGGETSA